MLKRIFHGIFSSLICLCIIESLVSCEVGLGSSVDTEPPAVTVSIPEADYIIRDTFTMSGTCSDDHGLKSVSVVLRNTSTSEKYTSDSWNAIIDSNKNTWSCTIEPIDSAGNTLIPDGSYEATVTAEDGSGRKTTATKSFSIDNTPPLLILTRPSTKGEINPAEIDGYGKVLSIAGQTVDDSPIDKMEVEVYGKDDRETPITTVTLRNVLSTIRDLSVATYGASNSDDPYNKIYGNEKGTQYYSCKIKIYDKARKCPPDANEAYGNYAERYYLFNDIYDDILEIYPADKVYAMLNGSYEDDAVATSVKLKLETAQVSWGTFSLNPSSSPSFDLYNYDKIPTVAPVSALEMKNYLKENNPLTNGSAITVKMSMGIDEVPLVKESLGIWLYAIKADDSGIISVGDDEKIWLIKPDAEAVTDSEKLARDMIGIDGSGYKATIALSSSGMKSGSETSYILPPLTLGTSYIVGADGYDKKNNNFAIDYSNGIYLESKGVAPKLKVTSPAAPVYLKKGASLDIYGTVEAEDYTTVTVSINDVVLDGVSWTSSVNNPAAEGETGKWGPLTIPAEKFNQAESDQYTVVVTAAAGTRESTKNITVDYDVDGPQIEIVSISPQIKAADSSGNVRKDNVNGEMRVSVSITDAYYRVDTSEKKPSVILYKGSVSEDNKIMEKVFSEASFEAVINTAADVFDGIDNTELVVLVTAYDFAGNSSTEQQTVYLNQSSDKPVITLRNASLKVPGAEDYTGSTYPSGGKKNVFLAGAPITAEISDDDGLSKVEVTIQQENGNTATESYTDEVTSNPWLLSYAVPTALGSYKLTVTAYDSSGKTNDPVSFWFKVDAGAPTIVIPAVTCYGKAGGKVSVSGTAAGVGGLKIYSRYDGADSSSNVEITGAQPAADAIQASWSDSLAVPEDAVESSDGQSNTYTVVDSESRTGIAVIKYYVDNTAPTASITTSAAHVAADAISVTDFRFEGTAADTDGIYPSGIKTVYYQIKSIGDAAPAAGSGTAGGWTALTAAGSWNFYQSFVEGTSNTVDAEGNITAYSEGSYKLYVYSEDNAGNASGLKDIRFDVDLNRPEIVTSIDGNLLSDSNTIVKTGPYEFTFTATDTLGMSADDPLTVTVSKDNNPLEINSGFTLTDKGNGAYAVEIPNAEDGLYSYTITVKDSVGKTAAAVRNVRLDSAAPVITVSSPTFTDGKSEWQTKKVVKIIGSAEDATGVQAVYYKAGGTADIPAADKLLPASWTAAGWTAVSGTTGWSVTTAEASVSEGENNIYFAAVDTNGNASAAGYILCVDTADPYIKSTSYKKDGEAVSAALSDRSSVFTNESFTLSGAVADSYKLNSIVLKGSNGDSDSTDFGITHVPETEGSDNTAWSWTKAFTVGAGENSLADGRWTFTLTVTDDSGRTYEHTYYITVDTESPEVKSAVLTWSDAGTDEWHKSNSATLNVLVTETGSSISAVYYYVSSDIYYNDSNPDHQQIASIGFDNAMNAGSADTYSKAVTFSDGKGYIYIKAVDNAGNIGWYGVNGSAAYQVDTVKPEITVENPVSGALISNTAALNISVKITDSGSGIPQTVNVKLSGTADGNGYDKTLTVNQSDGTASDTISADVISNITGSYTVLTVTASDVAGNSAEKQVQFLFDKTPPTVSIANPAMTTVNGSITVNGTAGDDNGLKSVKVYRSKLSDDGDADTDITVSGVSYILLQTYEGVNGYNWRLDNTLSFDDGANVTFYAVAEDSAGNMTSVTRSITVDQDADRPVIKFSNISLKDMSNSNHVWHKQSTLFGSIKDDDGVTEVLVSEDNGTTWSENIYENGAWEYTFNSDGSKVLMFKVTDSAGGEFISGVGVSAMSRAPKLTDGTNEFGSKPYNSASDTYVYLTVDTESPQISTASYYRTDAGYSADLTDITGWNLSSDITSQTFGGPGSNLYLMVTASDANDLQSLTASLGDKDGVAVSTLHNTAASPITLTNVIEFDTHEGDGYKTLKVTAVDKAGVTSSISYTVSLDNSAPNIKIRSHSDGNQVYGSLSVALKGDSDDASALYFAVTKEGSAPDSSAYTPVNAYTSATAWTVVFDGGNNIAGSSEYHTKTFNEYLDTLYGTGTSSLDDIKTVYVWMYGTDSLENVSVPVSCRLLVDPQGDKPSVSITYPNSGDTVGGTIRMTGTTAVATSDVTVDSVWLQIDPSYDEAAGFDSDWNTELESLISGKSVGYSIESPYYGSNVPVVLDGSVYGIKASGSSQSWNLTINSVSEFNNTDGTNRKIAVRAYAISSSGKISSDVMISFEIDPKSPVIGSTNDLYLVQYETGSSGTIVKQQKYEADMWISGQWYLIGSIEDDSGIKKVLLNDADITDRGDLLSVDYGISSTTSYRNYNMNIPVGNTNADSFGSMTYVIKATEGSDENKSTEATITLNYDNKAPVLSADLLPFGNEIVQSNGTYTIEGSFEETGSAGANQSGFERVALFFTRTLNGVTYVIDPMLGKGSDGTANRYDTAAGFAYNSGIYWRGYNVSSVSGSAVTLTEIPHDNIRTGGLCRIADIVYRITDVSGTVITVDGSPAASDTAYFAVAQVIDNLTTETGSTGLGNSITNDDGDFMVEGVTRQGTTYKWTVSINSTYILDGPVTMHFVAFDKAGNTVHQSYDGAVINNAPRIAGIRFGTDENGNKQVDNNEITATYSALSNGVIPDGAKLYRKAEMGTVGSNAAPAFTAKGVTVFIPEIVGGNASLGYSYEVAGTTTRTVANAETANLVAAISQEDLQTTDKAIKFSLGDFINSDGYGEISDGINNVTVKVWDKTEGYTMGTDSQYAQFSVVLNVNIRDKTPPSGHINPFYWNSESENSIYMSDDENYRSFETRRGHIELPSGAVTKPSVSGIVTLTGTAEDDSLLSGIYLYIDGFSFPNASESVTAGGLTYHKIASYDESAGKWTSGGSLASDGWEAEITDSISQSGHTASWKLYWNTAELSNAAAEDVSVRLLVKDRGALTSYDPDTDTSGYTANTYSYTGNAQTAEGSETAYYNMDVVPYITRVETSLSSLKSNNPSVFSRTALGHYPVRADEAVKVYGFNLTGALINGSAAPDGITSDASYDIVTVPVSGLSSGNLTLTVNGVSTINNNNDNTASYNEQHNGDNNNLLTDDVVLDVWEFNSRAAVPISGRIADPVMKINPVSGMIGFAFTNGPLYFSMGGTVNNTEYSYIYWQASYDFLSSIAFAYDSAGYSYGSAAGGDINSTQADKFSFMTSQWGCSEYDQNGSYRGENALRLESIGQKNGTVIDFNKNRIQSPVYATARHGTSTNIYLAYYDDINAEIRFRYGNLGDGSRKIDFGNFSDSETDRAPGAYDISRVSLIAGKATGRNPGEYVSIGVIPGTAADKDVVVAVWYDATDKKLMYSYNDDPTNLAAAGLNTGRYWKGARALFENAGEYCQLSVDANGGIHIAAYDTANADLKYAYLSSYNAGEAETCTVDSYGIIGTNITIDTAIVDGKAIPYIGYYALSSVRPKYAYLADSGSNAPDGVDNEAYTGAWEITLVPTKSTVGQDRINVGVWKELATGNLAASTNGTSTWTNNANGYKSTSFGMCYGNGTSNAVLAYAIRDGTSGYIETAQKK